MIFSSSNWKTINNKLSLQLSLNIEIKRFTLTTNILLNTSLLYIKHTIVYLIVLFILFVSLETQKLIFTKRCDVTIYNGGLIRTFFSKE